MKSAIEFVFWLAVAGDAMALAMFLMLAMAAEPGVNGRYGFEVAGMFLIPACLLAAAVLVFTHSRSPAWRAVSLMLTAAPWVFVLALKARDAVDDRVYADAGGRSFFKAGAQREIAKAIAAGDDAAAAAKSRAADVNQPGYAGMTLLALVLGPQHPAPHRLQALRLLLDAGADPNHPVHDRLPLEMACRLGPEAVALLLEHGADPNRRTSGGAPVYFAATGLPVPVAVLKILIDHGADLRAVDRDGVTAPLKAAENENWHAVLLLLRSGTAWDQALLERVKARRQKQPDDDTVTELIRFLERRGAPLL